MRIPFVLLLAVAAAPAGSAPKAPVKPKPAPGPAAKAAPKPKPAPKKMAFTPPELDLAPGESYLTELFVPSPTGKAVTGTLTFGPTEGLVAKPDGKWDGKVPPWGRKVFPLIAASPGMPEGEYTFPAKLDKGGEAALKVKVVAPHVEPVPGLRQVSVRITNPFRRVLQGKIKAANPDRFLQTITTREFNIPAGETGEVVFPLPGAAPAEGEKYDFTFTVDSYRGWHFERTYPLEFPPHT